MSLAETSIQNAPAMSMAATPGRLCRERQRIQGIQRGPGGERAGPSSASWGSGASGAFRMAEQAHNLNLIATDQNFYTEVFGTGMFCVFSANTGLLPRLQHRRARAHRD